MGLFDFLKPAPCPAHARQEVDKIVQELIRIGKTEDYLAEHPGGLFNQQSRHIRARELGRRLSDLGGIDLMDWVLNRVKKANGKELADHLGYAWFDVGDWKY